MDNDLTDEQLERFALMVEHLPPDEAQRAYEAKIEAARVMAEVERKKKLIKDEIILDINVKV
jgi:hypothetical protein